MTIGILTQLSRKIFEQNKNVQNELNEFEKIDKNMRQPGYKACWATALSLSNKRIGSVHICQLHLFFHKLSHSRWQIVGYPNPRKPS